MKHLLWLIAIANMAIFFDLKGSHIDLLLGTSFIGSIICGYVLTINLKNGKIQKTTNKKISYDEYSDIKCSAPRP